MAARPPLVSEYVWAVRWHRTLNDDCERTLHNLRATPAVVMDKWYLRLDSLAEAQINDSMVSIIRADNAAVKFLIVDEGAYKKYTARVVAAHPDRWRRVYAESSNEAGGAQGKFEIYERTGPQ